MSLQPIKKRIRSFAICDLEKLKDYSDFFSIGTVFLRPKKKKMQQISFFYRNMSLGQSADDTNSILANFLCVKCVRFCQDRNFRKRPSDFRKFPTTFRRLPNVAGNVRRFALDR